MVNYPTLLKQDPSVHSTQCLTNHDWWGQAIFLDLCEFWELLPFILLGDSSLASHSALACMCSSGLCEFRRALHKPPIFSLLPRSFWVWEQGWFHPGGGKPARQDQGQVLCLQVPAIHHQVSPRLGQILPPWTGNCRNLLQISQSPQVLSSRSLWALDSPPPLAVVCNFFLVSKLGPS